MSTDWSRVGSAIKGLGGLLGGAAVVAGGKKILDFRQRVGQLQAKMRASSTEAEAMMTQVMGVGEAHNLARDEVLGMVEVFQDFGGIAHEGLSVLDQLGKRAKAATVGPRQLAQVFSAMVDTGMSPEQAIQGIDQLIAQADAGTVSMEALAGVAAEVLKSGGAQGQRYQGTEGVDRLGKLMQVAGSVYAGSAEESRTAVRALFRDLTAGAGKLKKMKINVFDERGMRDVEDIMAQVLHRTGGDIQKLSKLFTSDSLAAVSAYKGAFDARSGQFGGVVAKVGSAQGSESSIDEMYRIRMHGVAAEAEAVGQAMKSLEADITKVGGVLIKWANENRASAAAAAVGVGAAGMLAPAALRGLFGMLARRGRRGGVAAGAAGAGGGLPGGGVTPVFVVNLPGANLGQAAGYFGPGGGALQGGGAAGATGQVSRLGQVAGGAAGALSALMVGYQVGSMFDQWLGFSDGISDWLVGGQRQGAKKRVEEHAAGAREGEVLKQAQAFAAMSARGMSRVQVRGEGGQAQQMALTQQQVLAHLRAQALSERGMSSQEWDKVADKIAAAVRTMPLVVRPADGLDRIEVARGRGVPR